MAKWQTQEDTVNNVYCYISRKGDDVNGDGSSTNPFYSVNKGVEYLEGLTTSLQRVLVMGTGRYYDESITVTRANSILFLGEPNVIVDGSGFSVITLTFSKDSCDSLKVINYISKYFLYSYTNIIPHIFNNCIFANNDGNFIYFGSAGSDLNAVIAIRCVYIDSGIMRVRADRDHNIDLINCTLINTVTPDGKIGGITRFKNCILYGDINYFVNPYFKFCNIYGTYNGESLAYYESNNSAFACISENPAFVDSSTNDFILQDSSPCLFRGESGMHIGAKSTGFSYDGDSIELTTVGGASLTNLQVTNGVLHRIDDTQDGELITARMGDGILRIFKTASLMATLGYDANGYINKAIDNDNDTTEASQQLDFEIIYGADLATYQANETAGNWKALVWNADMKVDSSGRGTANNSHDFTDSELIQMAYWKLRIKFRNV